MKTTILLGVFCILFCQLYLGEGAAIGSVERNQDYVITENIDMEQDYGTEMISADLNGDSGDTDEYSKDSKEEDSNEVSDEDSDEDSDEKSDEDSDEVSEEESDDEFGFLRVLHSNEDSLSSSSEGSGSDEFLREIGSGSSDHETGGNGDEIPATWVPFDADSDEDSDEGSGIPRLRALDFDEGQLSSSEESGSDESSAEEDGSDESSASSSEESGSDESSSSSSEESRSDVIIAEELHDHENDVVGIADEIPSIGGPTTEKPFLKSKIWDLKDRNRPAKNGLVSIKLNKLKNALNGISNHFSKKFLRLNEIVKGKKDIVQTFFKSY